MHRTLLPSSEIYIGKKVSSRSLWEDNVWIMDVRRPLGRERKIYWDIELSGGILTDVRHRQLLYTSKALIYELLHGSFAYHCYTMKPVSAIGHAYNLKYLVRWLASKQIYRFSDMTEDDIVAYCLWVKYTTVQSVTGRPETGKMRSPSSVRAILLPLRALITLSDRIADHPSGDRRRLLDIVTMRIKRARKGRTKHIPDEIAGPLFEIACTWLRKYAQPLIAQYRVANKVYQEGKTANPSIKAHIQRRLHAARNEPLEILYRDGSMVIESESGAKFLSLIRYLETACFVVIAGMVGMRVSEIGSLKKGCLNRERLDDGRVILLLSGLLFKTVKAIEGRRQEWSCGWDEPDNPVRSAIETLEALQAMHLSGSDELFVGLKRRYFNEHQALEPQTLRKRINDFAHFIGIDGWHFTPHQFRKTFARFVTKRDFTGLLALQRHFAHVSIQMTELYGSWDEELIEDVLDEEMQQDYEALDKILAADQLAGTLGEKIMGRNAQFRGLAGREARQEYFEQIKADSSEDRLMIMRHDYGYCVLEMETAACNAESWRVGPPTCSGCANFIVTKDHVPYWEQIQKGLQSELNDPRTEYLLPANKERLTNELKRVTRLLVGRGEKEHV